MVYYTYIKLQGVVRHAQSTTNMTLVRKHDRAYIQLQLPPIIPGTPQLVETALNKARYLQHHAMRALYTFGCTSENWVKKHTSTAGPTLNPLPGTIQLDQGRKRGRALSREHKTEVSQTLLDPQSRFGGKLLGI